MGSEAGRPREAFLRIAAADGGPTRGRLGAVCHAEHVLRDAKEYVHMLPCSVGRLHPWLDLQPDVGIG